VNLYQNIDYGLSLDNNWVYVYFCYKKLTESGGNARGYIYYPFEGDVKTVSFDGINHKAITDYAHF
jgi:hypothetical protein